ncbi:MAG: xanthine dehydrogenase family protein molybdopterin-binding subunit [Planctomycetes bacterium]|nr:xanthine dehydrogenase family protein molybdopterin-binding subunit [Planctomycetota bacterium]
MSTRNRDTGAPREQVEIPREQVEITVGYRALPGKDQQDRLEKITVEPTEGDAPPWDANTPYKVVGSDLDRVDGFAKATGRAKYAYDQNFPDLQQAMILRAPIARGTLTALDLDEARRMPGVTAVVALKDVGNKVRFVGDAIAAVAAPTLDLARDAIEKIRADYDQEEHNVEYLMSGDAPLLSMGGEVDDEWPADDDIDALLAKATHSHSGTYRTEVQTHSSLETHGNVARFDQKHLDVWSSTQATFGVRGELARALRQRGVDVESVEVHSEYVGGGFGSKFSAGIEGLACCLLAHEAQKPVKLMLDRFEEHTTAGNRPSALMQVRGALDENGRITVWDWRSFGGCGFNGSGGAVRHPSAYLGKAKVRQSHKDIACDTDPARSMRAPGYPQGWFGAELFLDELAAKAGLDPLALRLKNDDEAMRLDQWKFGAERFGWAEARAKQNEPGARYLTGAGLASARWGQLGNHGGRNPHGITCRIHNDGSVESRSGAQDIGTGLKTVLTMLTAEELGIAPARVRATTGHTSDPSGPGSGGSTTTPSLAPAVRHAAYLAAQKLVALVADHLGVPLDEVRCSAGKVGTDKAQLSWTDACKLIGQNPIEAHGERFPNYKQDPFHRGVCGAQFAEVRVDSWTGEVQVTRMFGIQDCGLVIAKKLAESQVLGAMIQGVSYALHEQRIMDQRSGRMLNGDFLRYKITGTKDLPALDCYLHSVANGHDNTGAAGLGEPPSTASAAAIGNAVFHAIGAPVRHLPLTPDKVLAALQKAQRTPR